MMYYARRLILFGAALVIGAAPATQPSNDALRTWYLQLADRDPEVREQARINLMGVRRKDLPALEKVVAENRPVQAAQAAVLYDIVMHVHMAGEPYQAAETWGGFLGLRQLETWTNPPGVAITTRIPGFCAYRMLREGDVIVGIDEFPGVEFNNVDQLTGMLRGVPPGTTLTFLVLRGGDVRKLPIKLDARPVVAVPGNPPENMALLESARQNKAEEYWTRAFAPLVGDQSVSALHP